MFTTLNKTVLSRLGTWQYLSVLLAVVVIGAGLRLWHLGSIPSILNRDEAALAYNALLLKETGQDEWQRTWPLGLESFGDYKLPGYPVILVAFFSLFGLSDVIVRLPSALAGIATIIVSYWIVQKLSGRKLQALALAAFVAITPVFIFYSRVAFEANLALLLFLISWCLLLLPQRNPRRKKQPQIQQWVWLSDLAAVAVMMGAVLTYNTPLLLLPFTIVVLPGLRGFKEWRRWIVPVLGLSLVFMTVAAFLLPLTAQKSGITIFSDETVWRESVLYHDQFSGIWQKVLGHKYVYMTRLVVANYLESISPFFLVTRGGSHPWHQAPGGGHLGWVSYGLGWLGIVVALKRSSEFFFKRQKSPPYSALLLLYWLVIGLVPAVITVDAPHATRSLFFFWAWLLAASQGLVFLLDWLKNSQRLSGVLMPQKERLVLLIVLAVIGWETVQYAHRYFGTFADNHLSWKPGYDRLLKEVEDDRPKDAVAVVDSEGYHYILTAWYLRMEPTEYFSSVVRQQPNQIGFKYGQQVGRWHFIADPEDRDDSEKVLIFWQDDRWQVELF